MRDSIQLQHLWTFKTFLACYQMTYSLFYCGLLTWYQKVTNVLQRKLYSLYLLCPCVGGNTQSTFCSPKTLSWTRFPYQWGQMRNHLAEEVLNKELLLHLMMLFSESLEDSSYLFSTTQLSSSYLYTQIQLQGSKANHRYIWCASEKNMTA